MNINVVYINSYMKYEFKDWKIHLHKHTDWGFERALSWRENGKRPKPNETSQMTLTTLKRLKTKTILFFSRILNNLRSGPTLAIRPPEKCAENGEGSWRLWALVKHHKMAIFRMLKECIYIEGWIESSLTWILNDFFVAFFHGTLPARECIRRDLEVWHIKWSRQSCQWKITWTFLTWITINAINAIKVSICFNDSIIQSHSIILHSENSAQGRSKSAGRGEAKKGYKVA